MRRTFGVLRSVIAFVALATAPGCELMPDPEFRAVPDALTLIIVAANRAPSPGVVDFDFQLSNRGTSTAMACLGPSRSVSYTVGSRSGSNGTLVDHPTCTHEFAIGSAGAMTWRETLEVYPCVRIRCPGLGRRSDRQSSAVRQVGRVLGD